MIYVQVQQQSLVPYSIQGIRIQMRHDSSLQPYLPVLPMSPDDNGYLPKHYNRNASPSRDFLNGLHLCQRHADGRRNFSRYYLQRITS